MEEKDKWKEMDRCSSLQFKVSFCSFWIYLSLKMPGPISQNGNFYSNDASSPKLSWFQISFKSVKPFGHKKRLRILQWPIHVPYCVRLIMVTITSHIFIQIFQTVHFSAVKFSRGNCVRLIMVTITSHILFHIFQTVHFSEL